LRTTPGWPKRAFIHFLAHTLAHGTSVESEASVRVRVRIRARIREEEEEREKE
jgi:hypothetical protein